MPSRPAPQGFAHSTVVAPMVAVSAMMMASIVMPAVVMMGSRRRMVMVPASAPKPWGDWVRGRAVSLVGGGHAIVEGLGARRKPGQQTQCNGDGDPAHDGFSLIGTHSAWTSGVSCTWRPLDVI